MNVNPIPAHLIEEALGHAHRNIPDTRLHAQRKDYMAGPGEKAPSASQGEESQEKPDLDLGGLLACRTENISCCEAMQAGVVFWQPQAKDA